MACSNPKVSVGLPVFNGEKYLRKCIDSILAQTFLDFELIISDNASTDSTEAICKEYASMDSRIRYYRNGTNIGGNRNHNYTFELSKGKYFQIVHADDVYDPDSIAKCVEVLDRDPTVVLCYSSTVRIDENGQQFDIVTLDQGLSLNPYERFKDLIDPEHLCFALYGLIRADVLRKTELWLNYPDHDRTLLCELSLHGRFYHISEPLFYKREHSKNSVGLYSDLLSYVTGWYKIPDEQKIDYCQLRKAQLSHYMRIVSRAPSLTIYKRISCYLHVIYWMVTTKLGVDITRVRRRFITKETFKTAKYVLLKNILPSKN
jgi:glycosyltransferase involved in cell wall biosynthesis